jgi:hypothetical protein
MAREGKNIMQFLEGGKYIAGEMLNLRCEIPQSYVLLCIPRFAILRFVLKELTRATTN